MLHSHIIIITLGPLYVLFLLLLRKSIFRHWIIQFGKVCSTPAGSVSELESSSSLASIMNMKSELDACILHTQCIFCQNKQTNVCIFIFLFHKIIARFFNSNLTFFPQFVLFHNFVPFFWKKVQCDYDVQICTSWYFQACFIFLIRHKICLVIASFPF